MEMWNFASQAGVPPDGDETGGGVADTVVAASELHVLTILHSPGMNFSQHASPVVKYI
jgi:hypothetical protein